MNARIGSTLPLAAALLALLLAPACGGGDVSSDAGDAASAQGAAAEATGGEAEGYEDIPTMDELEARMEEEVTEADADAEFEKLAAELAAEEDG